MAVPPSAQLSYPARLLGTICVSMVLGGLACVSLSGLSGGQIDSVTDTGARDAGSADRSIVEASSDRRGPGDASLDRATPPPDATSHDASTVRFIQCADSNDATATCNTKASAVLTQPVTEGDLLLVALYTFTPDGSPSGPTMTLEDTLGSTFVALDNLRADGKGLQTFYAIVPTSGASDTIRMSFTPCIPNAAIPYVAEYSGLSTVVAHRAVFQPQASTDSDGVVITMATDAGGVTLWAMSASNIGESSFTAGAGFTLRQAEGGTFPGATNANVSFGQAEDRPAIAVQPQVASWTISPVSDMLNAVILLR